MTTANPDDGRFLDLPADAYAFQGPRPARKPGRHVAETPEDDDADATQPMRLIRSIARHLKR